nr:OB-fold-containig protein [Desulfosarcina cetonica]
MTAFGLIGFGIQSLAVRTIGNFLPRLPAMGGAFVLSLPLVRFFGGILGRIMPKDETEAVTEQSFIGRVAVITTGNARAGSPAQGKVIDHYGQAHYVMIAPDQEDDVFPQGTAVLLVSQQGATFTAIRNPSAVLGARTDNPDSNNPHPS